MTKSSPHFLNLKATSLTSMNPVALLFPPRTNGIITSMQTLHAHHQHCNLSIALRNRANSHRGNNRPQAQHFVHTPRATRTANLRIAPTQDLRMAKQHYTQDRLINQARTTVDRLHHPFAQTTRKATAHDHRSDLQHQCKMQTIIADHKTMPHQSDAIRQTDQASYATIVDDKVTSQGTALQGQIDPNLRPVDQIQDLPTTITMHHHFNVLTLLPTQALLPLQLTTIEPFLH